MISLLIALALMQGAPCHGEAAPHEATAVARGEAFDPAGASDAYFTAAGFGCAEADIAAHYLRGLVAARAAYAYGGSPESLAPVRQAVAFLEARAPSSPVAEMARVLLLAAAASAQSERGEMGLLLDHAVSLEAVQLEARQPGLPVVTAHEAAGDLWLQVHGYDEARRAYLRAAARLGETRRVRLGLARVAVRAGDAVAACTHYRALVSVWGRRADEAPEIREARDYVQDPVCGRQGP